MRAMVLETIGRPLRLVRRSIPVPSASQVVVRVAACGVCRTDLHVVDGELPDTRLPIVPGHEIVGTVAAAGADVGDFARGDRVGIPWLAHTCGRCAYCTSGRENLCDAARFTGYASGTACVFVILQFLMVRDLEALDLPLPVYGYGACMAIVCTVLPLWMMAEGVRRIGASQSSLLSSIGPVATIVLAAILLDEPVTIVQVCGAALVLSGVWLVGTRREAAQPAPQKT